MDANGPPDPATNTSPRPLAIVDIDGVVADVRHRLHYVQRRPKDWHGFFAAAPRDPAHPEGVALVQQLAQDHEVVFLTGRPDWLRHETLAWFDRHGLGGFALLMRPEGDRRPAAQVKLGLLKRLARGRHVAVVVDDDPVVLAALKAAGYRTFAATWEQRSDEADAALLLAQEAEGRT